MATEADFPEAISVTKGEGEDRYLTCEQFDRNVEQFSPLELNKSKGELDQHHEIEKPFADGENVKVDCSTQVGSKNNSFGISESEHFLAPLSEISQADQSNQAGMEIAKTEDAKLQVERVEASKNETTVDQHVQAVISYQQDSAKENLQRLENEAETSEVDVKLTEKADGNAESYCKEDSGLLEATTFQEYEASSSTLDFTNNSLKKDIEMETNVDNSSSTNPIFQEEFKEETSTKLTSNIEDDSQQTMHNYEPEEELQKFPEVMPENAKTESASDNAGVITCTDEERAIQNTKEYSEKEEAIPVHSLEKVFEATRTEQVTGEHALQEIHTAEDHPQEFDEENSTNLQACVEAADVSANTEEKNLVEEVIQEKCSSLVEEQTTEKISSEEEIHVTDLKKEEKEADAKYEEPIEVADTTRKIEFETIEQRTETNKDLYVPIPEEEAYAEESTKAFVQNNSFLSEISEVKTKEIIQEVCPTVSDYGLVSGEVGHVSGSKEAEAENKEHVENNPEQKALQTILTNEMALETEDHAQAEEGFNSKENMEREIQTAEDEGERDVTETSIVLEEEGPATILTDQTALQTEDVELQAEENIVDSKDILEKQIPTAADEGENGLMEAQAENNEKVTDTDITTEEKGLATIVTDEGDTGLKEAEEVNKEQVNISDISPEEKVLPTILTDEAALDIEDIDVQAEQNSNSKENLEKQIPVVADEGLKEAIEENKEQVKINDNSPEEILTDEAALDNEEIELQGEENVNSKDNSEKQIPTVADEGEICLAKAEAENNEQATITDITPEEKGLATISTDEKALDTEDIDVQAEESFTSEEKLDELIPTTEVRNTEISPEEKDLVAILANETSLDIQDPNVKAEETSNSKENLEKKISEAPDKGDTCVKETGEENKEQVKNTDISPEEKGQETIIIDETTQDIEYIDVQAGKNFISKEILEIPKAVDEDETDLTEAEAENKEHVETTEKGPEEKGLATILTDETAEDIEYNDAQAANINSKEFLEKQIPTAVDEGETDFTEAEADYKQHVEYTDIAPEQKGVETILRDEPALELEDVEQEQENFNSKENLENQIPTAVDEGEADLNQGEAENKEQVTNSDITVLRDETALDIEDLQAKENQIPKEASEGEEKVGHGDIVFDHTPVNIYRTELVGDSTVEESFQLQSHEDAEQKLGVKDEKSEDHPERNDMIVEEPQLLQVLEEPKVTSRDFKEEEIIGGNVTIFTPELIEEDTVKNSQDNEKEENANDLSPEYIPEDGSEKFKVDKNDAVKSEGEILEHSQNVGVEESITCETKNVKRSEDILSTLPVKYDQESSPAPKEALKEENIYENTFSIQAAKDNDGDNGAVTVTETCAKAPSNDEEDSPQILKYEPAEEITKLPDVLPEDTIPESSNEIAEVITCTKEAMQESLDKACNEAAELSTEGEKEKRTSQEVSSSLIGEETTEESSKEEENFVTSLQEEKNKEHEVCKEAIEAKSETLEDTTEQKPISEEESNKSLVEDNSFLSKASEKEIEKEIQSECSCTVINFDSEVVSDEIGLSDATAENKEPVETTHITPEGKDNAGTGVYNTELVRKTIEPSFQVQPLQEEAKPKLEVEDGTDKSDHHPEKNNKILEEVLDEPKITNRDFNEEQITEGNVVKFASESIVEETVTNYQDDEKETEKLNEEGSSIENIKEGNINDISTKGVPEDRGEKLEECIGEAVESKEEILQESQIDGLGKIISYDTNGAEKTDSDAPKEETIGGSEVVPESDSKSIDVVAKDEIIADQTLDEDISKEPSTLLSEEKELRDPKHEYGTTIQDTNIEEEHAKEVEVPTADDTGDLFTPRSAEETCLPKEDPREKVCELALEKLEAGESKEEIKETFETVSKFDSQSINVVSEDEIITDQTQCEGIIDAPLQIPSYTLLPEEKDLKASEAVQETLDADTPEEEIKDGSAMVPKFDSKSTDEVLKNDIISDQTLQEGLSTEQLQTPSSALLLEEKELRASEHEHETTTVDKNLDEEKPKEVEVPSDEDKQDLYTATPAKETCLQADEPNDSELALQKLDAGEVEEKIKGTFETVSKSDSQSIFVACGDDILADQTLCEGITDPPLSKDREFGATELALEKRDAEDTEEINVPEIVTKFDFESIEIVSNNEVIADQTFNEGITKEQIQSPSSTLLPEKKKREASEPKHETTAQEKNTEQECTKEVEVSADEDTQALFTAGPVEEKSLQKEEPSELNVSELAQEKLHAGDIEEANETFETVSKPDFTSTVAVSSEEITTDKILRKGVTDIPLEIPTDTSLHEEKELKASELNLEKLDADIPEEEIKEGSKVIPQSNSQSTYEVSEDEIIADQLQIPSFALLPDGKELKAFEHEYETTTDDKNIEDENLKEVEEPTGEATQDLFAARSAVEKEEPSELKVPELALEKLDAVETQEVKETFETVSKSDSESIYAVSKNELTDEHVVCEVITDMPLHIPSYTSLTKENELNASELALEKLDANATEEVKEGSEVTPKSELQSIEVVVKDENIADQVLHEVKTKDQLHIQSSILLPEEKELKESEHEHGTATQYKNLEEEYAEEIEVTADEDSQDLFVARSEEKTQLQKEEPRELKVSELAPENLDVGETEEEITQNFERVSKPDPDSIDAVSKVEIIAEQTLHQSDEQLQIASPTLLPKEKKEPEDCRVPELALKELNAGENEEEAKEAFETQPEFSSQSIGELATNEIVDQIPPSSLLTADKRCENTTTMDKAEGKSMNVVETPNDESRKDTNIGEETSIPNEEPRELNLSDLEFHLSPDTHRDSSNEVHEEEGCSLKEVPKVESREDEEEEIYVDSNETKKNEASNEERNLGVATSDSRAEDWCETTIEANETAKIEVPNEEIKDEKEVAKDSQLIYVGEENIRESQRENESREEKYPEEKNETFSTAPSENHHEVTNPMEKDLSVEISQEGILGFKEAYGNTQDIKQLEKESQTTNIPSTNEAALNFLQDPTMEDTKPSHDTLVATETKEEKVSESGVETADSTSSQISERLMNEPTKERMKVITHLTEEKEPTVSKELQADKEEEDEEEHENVEEAKTDEEKKDTEHKRTYQGYDEPVIVEASTDTEAKVKKSHSILSGMGSKVKHSISKVKKAIIGKSSNSKTQSEK